MNNSIFISYRRGTSSWATRALHDELCKYFPHEQVFMDVDDIDYGTDFVAKIEQEVGSCGVVLGVIDPQWVSVTDAQGSRRIDNPDDYVRLEIGMGLKRRIPVVPVLVDGATIPRESELPEDLRALSQHNAIQLRHSHFETDCKQLVESLKKALRPKNVQGAIQNNEKTDSHTTLKVARLGLMGTLGAAVIAALVALIINWPFGEDVKKNPSDISVTATDGGISVGGNIAVGGDLTIHQELDPAMLQFVEKTVDTLATQLDVKDRQLQFRDEQMNQLTEAVAALAREKDKPDAPPGLDQALTKLKQGNTEHAKRIFQQLVDTKLAQSANKEAAAAARHLGALALLNDEQEARNAYQRATELDPENIAAKNQLSYLQKQPGQFRLQTVLAEGGDPIDARYYVYHAKQDLDGKRVRVKDTISTTITAKFTLNAGRYFVEAVAGNARTSQEFDVQPGQLINTVMNLQAGQFRLQTVLAEGGDPIDARYYVYHAKQDLDGKRVRVKDTISTTITAKFTLNAGRYFVEAVAGNARTSQEFDVQPGQLINTVMNLQAGQFRLQTVLAEGGDPIDARYYVYHAKQDLDGKRVRVKDTISTTITAKFTLNAGRYFVEAVVGNARTSQEFDVQPGQLINTVMNLQAGQFRLQTVLAEGGDPIDARYYVYHAKQDLDGKRVRVKDTISTTITAKFTLNAGRYFVEAVAGNARTSQEFDVQPGQLVNQSLLLTSSATK